MNHHNTTHEPDSVVATYSIKNKRQEDIILGYMQTAKRLTSSEAHLISFGDGYNWPITSVRRTLDTLWAKGFVFQTNEKQKSPRGRNEYIWQITEEE